MSSRIWVVVLALTLAGCGESASETGARLLRGEHEATVDLDVSEVFTSIVVEDGFDVAIEAASPPAVELTSDNVTAGDVDARVAGGVLTIAAAAGASGEPGVRAATVRAPNLHAVTATTGSHIDIGDSILTGTAISITVESGASVSGMIATQSLTVDVSGGASAILAGSAANATIVGSNGAEVSLADTTITNLEVDLTASSKGSAKVTETLAATLAAGSSFTYSGTPEIISQEVTDGSELAPV